jgi:hypothetical protein
MSLLCELRIKGFRQLEGDHRHGKYPAQSFLSYQLPTGITVVGCNSGEYQKRLRPLPGLG